MYPLLQLLTLGLFAGSTCAVFYIPGSVVSYPKMGKRAFYTNATGNRYPLMGRRSSPSNRDAEKQDGASAAAAAVVQENAEYNKRGVFTQGPHRSFPRVGRSGSQENLSTASVAAKIRSDLLRTLTDKMDRNLLGSPADGEVSQLPAGSDMPAREDNPGADVPLTQFLFLIFDENGDGQLSKAEFSTSMDRIMQQNLLC